MKKALTFSVMVLILGVAATPFAYSVQSNIFLPFLNPSNFQASARVNNQGALQTATANNIVENLSASAVVKASPGYVAQVSIVSAPSDAVTVYDASTLATATAAKKMAVLTSAAGHTVQTVNLPAGTGIVVDPGTSGVVAVSYQ